MVRSVSMLLLMTILLADGFRTKHSKKSAKLGDEPPQPTTLARGQDETLVGTSTAEKSAVGVVAGRGALSGCTCLGLIAVGVLVGYLHYLHLAPSAHAAVSPKFIAVLQTVGLGAFYIAVSAVMIESNKWLMAKDHFPYPVTLTTFHMLVSFLLATCLRMVRPQYFPSLQNIDVTPKFCLKFVPIGIPFAVSLICGNWAYQYLSVSFLQVMKQSNLVTVYVLSVIMGLELLRRTSILLLVGVFLGAFMAVEGELHFVLVGVLLQVASSLCEATKTVFQSIIMSGETKLDALTMVLFMAPACFLANLLPLIFLEGSQLSTMLTQIGHLWPFLLVNTCLAFILNATVAQCIKQLSAVGFLLCGITKDICIIVSSAWFLGESLSGMQQVGFVIALGFVALYSLYKQNIALFHDDDVVEGFQRVFASFSFTKANKTSETSEDQCETSVMGNWQGSAAAKEPKHYVRAS